MAQDASSSDRAELFAYLARNPGDVKATLRYADLSKEAGDIEAAIGALERVLFYEPNEPNTRLYLGLLYSRLGSYDMARGYFESVVEHPATPPAIRERAAYLMAQSDENTEPWQFRNFVRTGLRWQSNANGEPDKGYFAYSADADQYQPVEGNPEGDWNAYLQTGSSVIYDFGNQNGDQFEATVTTYSTAQFDFDEYNYNVIEATAGVRFGIPTDNPTQMASIKPYLIAGGATVDYDPYYWSGGVGVQGTAPLGAWTFAPYVQAIYREFEGDAFNPPPDDFDPGATGWVYSTGVRITSDPKAAQRLQVHVGYERREVSDKDTIVTDDFNFDTFEFSTDYQSYHRAIIEVRTPFDLYAKGHHILVTPLLGVRYTIHDSEDPFAPVFADGSVFPGEIEFAEREDWEFRAGLAVDYAINDWAGVGGQISYTITDSNIPAYDTDNFTVSFGPHFRF